MGDMASSVHAMAVLFALDRRAAIPELRALTDDHDVVLVDRYVASNAAYSAARLHEDADGDVVGWVHELEIGRFGLPVPAHQLLLAPPREVAAARARSREAAEPDRALDAYESDDDLQSRTDAVYRGLAAAGWLSPWTVLGDDHDTGSLAGALLH
jgi:dTMP kinase